MMYQLFTIHGKVGEGEDSTIVPLVYVLMSGKSQEEYSILFEVRTSFVTLKDVTVIMKTYLM